MLRSRDEHYGSLGLYRSRSGSYEIHHALAGLQLLGVPLFHSATPAWLGPLVKWVFPGRLRIHP